MLLVPILALGLLAAFPVGSHAQVSGKFVEDILDQEILYSGFYVGRFKMDIDAPPDTASDEIKGYTAVLPDTLEGRIGVVQFGLARFSFNISFLESETEINREADINQTVGNPADDVFVLSATRKGVQLSLSYTPLSFMTLGLGQDQSDMIFFQRSATGLEEENVIPLDNTFLFFNLFFSIPLFENLAPLVTFNVAVPFDPGEFSLERQAFFGRTTFLMIGVLF